MREHEQSLWLDFLAPDLKKLIEKYNLTGLTSNPSIFEKAICDSNIYSKNISFLKTQNINIKDIYENLAIRDIQKACDILSTIYKNSKKIDGYASMEVSPHLALDAQSTIEEAQRLWYKIDRPNLMIKVPGTKEGLIAVEELIYLGININITLLFSISFYQQAFNAYISGLKRRIDENLNIKNIHSVASFFISRIDIAIDDLLEKDGRKEAMALRGQIAIANAQVAYENFLKIPWPQEANPQRLLWASTSSKNPAYHPAYYANNLIAKNTVNTLPLKTLEAFYTNGEPSNIFTDTLQEGQKKIHMLSELGIDLDYVTQDLLDDGLKIFQSSFDNLLNNIAKKF